MREKALSLFGVKIRKNGENSTRNHKYTATILMKKREIELQARLDEAEAQLKDREITIEKSGSIADAAMQLSGVFQAAQEAADTYLKSIKATARHV